MEKEPSEVATNISTILGMGVSPVLMSFHPARASFHQRRRVAPGHEEQVGAQEQQNESHHSSSEHIPA